MREGLSQSAGSFTEAPALYKTLSVNHVVELSPDYGKLKNWYHDLLDLRVSHDSGRDIATWAGRFGLDSPPRCAKAARTHFAGEQ